MRSVMMRVLSALCSVALLLSMVVIPNMGVTAVGEQGVFDTMNPDDILANFDYHDFILPYGAGVGDAVVSDAEAEGGYAAKLSYEGRAASGDDGLIDAMLHTEGQSLGLYVSAPAPGTTVSVGMITASELRANTQKTGYTLYKFDDVTILPEAGEGRTFFYMFDCWGFQITLDAYKNTLLGEEVDLYLSMKVTGDVGNSTDNTPAYYIDRVVITSANPETLVHGPECKFANYAYQGDAKMGAIPTPPASVGELLEKADSSDILARFDYQNFSLPYGASFGDVVVADADSSIGQAATLSYAARSGEAGLASAMIISDTLKLHTHSPGIWDAAIGELPAVQLQANAQKGGYTLYKFDNVDILPAPAESGNMLYLFECQGLRAPLDSYKAVLEGQTVDVYLSLKVTGDVTNTTDNTPAYYIDSLIITTANAMETRQISLGTMVGTCIYKCGKTNTVQASSEHIQLFDASDFTFAYGSAYEDKVVTDADSVMGSAARYAAYPRRNEANNCLILSQNGSVPIYTNAGDVIGELSAKDLKVNQGYQLYRFSHENLSIADSASLVYIFGDWGLQNPALFTALKENKGKTVDIYLSMKITGDIYGENLSLDSEENWPVYYIDKVIVAEACSFDEYISDNNATCGSDGTKSRSCGVCGLTEYAIDSGTATGLHSFTAEVVEEKYCKSVATCQQAAIYYKSCGVCGLSSQGQTGEATFEYGATTEHSFTTKPSDQLAAVATCDAPARYYVQCDWCDVVSDSVTVSIDDIKAHTYGNWTDDKDGQNHSRICTACNEKEVQPHVWDRSEIIKKPTAESEGEKLYTCSQCGATKTEVLQKIPGGGGDIFDSMYPEDILASLDYHDFVLPYGADVGDTIVSDPQSVIGRAAELSYEGRAASGDSGLMKSMIRTGGQRLDIYVNSPAPGSTVSVGRITANELKNNAKNGDYTLYKFDNVKPVPAAGEGRIFLYAFDCWGFQVNLTKYKDILLGKKVDIYISLKVTGDVSNTTNNTPAYYIDRVIITSAEPKTIVHGDECKFGNYVYQGDGTANSAGSLVGTCIYKCGNTNVIPANGKHVKVFGASDFTFAYGDTYEDQVVVAGDSVMGSAVQYAAYPRRNEDNNCLIMDEGGSLLCYTNTGDAIGIWHSDELKVNQGYQLYKFSHESLVIDDSASLVYFFGDWGLQNPALLTALKACKGKTVDIFVSMKITGDIYGENLSMDSEENWPVYYIDKVILAEACSLGEYASDNNATCGADGTKSASCSICGLTEYALDSGSATGLHDFTAQVVEQRYCKRSASCGVVAEYYKSCTVCGASSKGHPGEATFKYGEALTHRFSSYIFDDNATCTEDATKHRTCAICGRIETLTVSDTALGHSFTKKASDKLASEANCDSPALYFVQCDRCDEISDKLTVAIDDVRVHTYGAWSDSNDGQNHIHICTACGSEEQQPHTWDDGRVTKEPTTKEEGEKQYTCSECGATKTEVLEKVSEDHKKTPNSNGTMLAVSGVEIWLIIFGAMALATAVAAAVLLLRKKK